MFASGNDTERKRMGQVHAKGETVVDLYAVGKHRYLFDCLYFIHYIITLQSLPNKQCYSLFGEVDVCSLMSRELGISPYQLQ